MILFVDTETTGLPSYHLDPDDLLQPHVIQMTILDEHEMRLNEYAIPAVPIPPQATAIHGIDDEMIRCVGRPRVEVAMLTWGLLRRASLIVGFNIAFDRFVTESLLQRARISMPWPPVFCCMKATRPLLNLPPTQRQIDAGYGNEPKMPSLAEAYGAICGKAIRCAHDSLADTEATRELFFTLRAMGAINV